MSQFDVIVVGAGPSGCAAAIACAQRGMRVAILERQVSPRHRPGETQHPGIEPLLAQLGVVPICLQSSLRHEGHWVHWEGAPRFVPFGGDQSGTWRGFQIHRAFLDAQMLNRARALGAQVIQPCPAPAVTFHHGRVRGLTLKKGALSARYVVDASGRSGWLRRQLKIRYRVFSPPLIARYGYCKGSLDLVHDAPRLLATVDGWQWIARVDNEVIHWTQMSLTQGIAPAAKTPQVLKHLPPAGPIGGADVTWRLSNTPMGPGYIQIGDAASILDPASSHGVLKAIMSGIQAAQAIADCFSFPLGERVIHEHFNKWVHDQFNNDTQVLRRFYRTHPYPPVWNP